MDNQRLLVWVALGLLAFMTYQQWTADYGPQSEAQTPPATGEPQDHEGRRSDESLPSLPATQAPRLPADAQQAAGTLAAPDAAAESSAGQVVRVSTDVLEIEINTAGGKLQNAILKKYPVAKDRPDTLVQLLSPDQSNLATIQNGLIEEAGDSAPYFNSILSAEQPSYELGDAEELVVPLVWDNGNGVRVEKRLHFSRGSYRIDVEQHVTNSSDKGWRAAQYSVLKRRFVDVERSMTDVDTYSFDGPIVFDGASSEKLDRDDLLKSPFELNVVNGWAASIQHHFLRAIVPPEDVEHRIEVRLKDNVSTASIFGPATAVAAGGEHAFTTTVYVGPKLQSQLGDIAQTLKLTVDYGILTLLSNPLFWLLNWIYGFVGNWGVAIILVTVIIKMLFYKLTEKSGRSMAKMREIQPRMKALQDRYKDDKPAQSQAMMELYKREGVNPAAGCLPILIQMPFFLAFYWVLLESVEMRQAPFALWITDLSSRDPYFILPLIMGAAMLMQQKLNPAPADPVQAKVMQIMPIVFTVFLAFFPSGLVLYWATNTILSIAQQWYVNKVVEEERQARKGKKKKPKSDK